MKKIGIIIGSLREESFTRSVANHMAKMFAEGFETRELEIADLPFYNEDIDKEQPPVSYERFRRALFELDAFLFFTPEYNRSFPAVIKNALDVGSRPYGKNQWDGKPAAIISVSPGKIGGFGANQQIREAAVCLNMPMMQQPEAYIGEVHELLDENREIKETQTKEYFQSVIDAYVRWVKRFSE